ncbi:unnamed protein product, partial [Iphiclides podalirius]
MRTAKVWNNLPSSFSSSENNARGAVLFLPENNFTTYNFTIKWVRQVGPGRGWAAAAGGRRVAVGGGGGGAAGGAGGAWAGRERERERERDRERERQARAHQMSHAHAAEPDASSLFPAPVRAPMALAVSVHILRLEESKLVRVSRAKNQSDHEPVRVTQR